MNIKWLCIIHTYMRWMRRWYRVPFPNYWYEVISSSVVGSVLVIILTFSYWGITRWGTVSVSRLKGDGTVSTMDNTIYKLFPLLVLPCLSDLVLLIQYITICPSTIHTSIRIDTPTRLPIDTILLILLLY